MSIPVITPYEGDLSAGYVVQPADWNGSFDNIINYINTTLVTSINTLQAANSAAGYAQCRLTLSSTLPVADASAASTIYLLPYQGNFLSTYDGSSIWTPRMLTSLSYSLSGLTFPANYDLFCFWNGSALALDTPLQWTNDTTPVARQSVNGVLCKGSDSTRRWMGSFRALSATTTNDSTSSRWLSNAQNQVVRPLFAQDTTSTWTATATSPQAANGNTTDGVGRVSFLQGNAAFPVQISAYQNCGNSFSDVGSYFAIGYDSTTVGVAGGAYYQMTGGGYGVVACAYVANLPLGYHYVQRLQWVNADTGTYYGNYLNGMTGAVFN
jgi:hypothetical protein